MPPAPSSPPPAPPSERPVSRPISRAVLHIGTHKTATTMIQNALAANRPLLARHGLIYPEIGRATGHHSLLTRWLALDPYYLTSVAPADLWRGLARHARPGVTLLLSSEEFSRGWTKRVDLAEIRDFLAPFDRVEVVCVLRDQLSLVQSIHLEVAKKKAAPAFPDLVARAMRNGHAVGVFLDYGALHDFLLTGFDADAIRFIDYAAARAAPGGVLGALLDHCAAGTDPAALGPVDGDAANISPEPLAFWAAGIAAAPHPPPAALVALARRALAEEFGPDRRSLLYTPAEYRRLAAHVAPLNAAFEARVRAVQPGFALSRPDPDPGALPEPGSPGAPIWRSDLKEGFWSKFARLLWTEGGDLPRPAE